jgi:hypothetical protein
MSVLKKIRKFYKSSDENKVQIHEMVGFILIPIIVMMILYVCVLKFWK